MKSLINYLFISLMAMGLCTPLAAQDLADNETCLECHADFERAPSADPNMPQVHNPEGGFFAEAHDMWSCVDCHTSVEEVPHPDGFENEPVDCLDCHEEIPSK
jgi:hypothetical protein